jgi:hypothetical protein
MELCHFRDSGLEEDNNSLSSEATKASSAHSFSRSNYEREEHYRLPANVIANPVVTHFLLQPDPEYKCPTIDLSYLLSPNSERKETLF